MKSGKIGAGVMIVIVIILTVVGFASFKFDKNNVEKQIIINIDNSYGNLFITESTVKKIITDYKEENNMLSYELLHLRDIEFNLKDIDFVNDAQVSRDIKGNVIIDIEQETPLARIISNDGKGGYITQDNRVIGLSNFHTARVLVITGSGADSLMKANYLNENRGISIVEFIKYINTEPFWKKQISQLSINSKMEIMLYLQIGKQQVEIGKVENYKDKLEKLVIFYEKIIPTRGWGKYKFVSVKYENQIVCK